MIAPARHRRGGFFIAGFPMARTGKTTSDGAEPRFRPGQGSTRRKRSTAGAAVTAAVPVAAVATDRPSSPLRRKTSRRRSGGVSPPMAAAVPPPRFGRDVLAALAADFAEHGPAVIAAIRAEKPVEYLKLLASLLPKEPPPPSSPDPIDGLTDDELAACIAELRAQIAADRQSAGAQPDGPEGGGTDEAEPAGALPAIS
jgi:hypothetical protein